MMTFRGDSVTAPSCVIGVHAPRTAKELHDIIEDIVAWGRSRPRGADILLVDDWNVEFRAGRRYTGDEIDRWMQLQAVAHTLRLFSPAPPRLEGGIAPHVPAAGGQCGNVAPDRSAGRQDAPGFVGQLLGLRGGGGRHQHAVRHPMRGSCCRLRSRVAACLAEAWHPAHLAVK